LGIAFTCYGASSWMQHHIDHVYMRVCVCVCACLRIPHLLIILYYNYVIGMVLKGADVHHFVHHSQCIRCLQFAACINLSIFMVIFLFLCYSLYIRGNSLHVCFVYINIYVCARLNFQEYCLVGFT